MPRSASLRIRLQSTCMLLVLMLFVPSGSSAWTEPTLIWIAEQAARLAPPDLYRQLRRNRASLAIGVSEPFADQRHHQQLEQSLEVAVNNAILSIRAPRPFNEICYRLGVVAHVIADLNNPLNVADNDRQERRYTVDYSYYLESIRPRLSVAFYGFRLSRASPDPLQDLIGDARLRGRQIYPLVGREYRRIRFTSGIQGFDDRSTAFATATLAYNHAISDIAEALRYIWIEGGGIDSRDRLPIRGAGIVPIDRGR